MATAKSRSLVKKLQALKVREDGMAPPEALEILGELSEMAAVLTQTRAKTKGKTPHEKPEDCVKLNTYWNSFLWLIGICDAWTECMYGCDD